MPKKIKVEYVRKGFDISEGIELPRNITHHRVDDSHLFIAPEKAAWITTGNLGKDIIHYFQDGYSIEKVMKELTLKGIKKETIISELRRLLIDIEKNGFLANAIVKDGEVNDINLHLYLTNKCNLRCRHCYMDSGLPLQNELSTEDFISVIDQFAAISKNQVILTGGEPLLFPDIMVLIKQAKEKGLKVSIFTNGTLIDEKFVSKIEDYVDEIQFSLDGASSEVNDNIRGKGVFQRVLKTADLLKKTNIKLRLAMVIMPQNVEDLKTNIIGLARRLDGVEMKLSFALKAGRSNQTYRFASSAVAENELQVILTSLYQNRLKAMTKIEPNLIIKNCGYGEVITISSNGDIYPCALLINKAGNLKKNNFRDIVDKIRADTKASNVENYKECSTCDLKYICFGGCRLNNIIHNKSLFKVYCPPGKKEDYYRLLVRRSKFDALGIWLGCNN